MTDTERIEKLEQRVEEAEKQIAGMNCMITLALFHDSISQQTADKLRKAAQMGFEGDPNAAELYGEAADQAIKEATEVRKHHHEMEMSMLQRMDPEELQEFSAKLPTSMRADLQTLVSQAVATKDPP